MTAIYEIATHPLVNRLYKKMVNAIISERVGHNDHRKRLMC